MNIIKLLTSWWIYHTKRQPKLQQFIVYWTCVNLVVALKHIIQVIIIIFSNSLNNFWDISFNTTALCQPTAHPGTTLLNVLNVAKYKLDKEFFTTDSCSTEVWSVCFYYMWLTDTFLDYLTTLCTLNWHVCQCWVREASRQ